MSQVIKSSSKTQKEHRFFERVLDNDLDSLYSYLSSLYQDIKDEKVYSFDNIFDGRSYRSIRNDSIHPGDSISSITAENYNIFRFEHPGLRKLAQNVRSMVIEACDYYGIDFDSQNYFIHGWFNLYSNPISEDFVATNKDSLGWHEHSGDGIPYFHGYYCVNAEPSETYYKIFDEDVEIKNINNRAILSETGHQHAMGQWNLPKPRITIAYDIIPIENVPNYDFRRQNDRDYFPLL